MRHRSDRLRQNGKVTGNSREGWRAAPRQLSSVGASFLTALINRIEAQGRSAQKLNTTTKVLQLMIKDGLVTTRVRPTDGRVTGACLSGKGDQLRKLALVEARAIYDKAFAGIDPARVREMNKLMSEPDAAMKKL